MDEFRGLLVAGVLLIWPSALLAQNAVEGIKITGDQPIQIESNRFEVREAEGIGIFTGNVSVVQGPNLLKAAKMTVFYNQEGGSATTGTASIQRLVAEGGVYLKSENQVATGDKGTYDMDSGVLTLTGDEVVLSEGENVVVGCTLTMHTETGEATLESCGEGGEQDGRVRMLITPDTLNQEQ